MQMREQYHEKLDKIIPDDAVAFDITPAAQWFLRDSPKKNFDFSEVGPIMPPYPNMWIEFSMPNQIKSERGLRDVPSEWRGNGCLLMTSELPDDVVRLVSKNHKPFLTDVLDGIFGREMTSEYEDKEPEVIPRWFTKWIVFTNWKKGGVVEVTAGAMTIDPSGRHIVHLDAPMPTGMLSAMFGMNVSEADADFAAQSDHIREQMEHECSSMKAPFMFSLALLNCRNVKVIDKPPTPAPILKQRAKKGIPFIQYKILDVLPLRSVGRGQKATDEPTERAMHFVRGHFKNFNDKGLFGRSKGTYWWHNQVRGETSKGIVDKDYRVRNDK